MRRAFIVSGFDCTGVVWAESSGKARMVAARSASDAFNISIGSTIVKLSVKRASEYDDLVGYFHSSYVVTFEAIEYARTL